MVVACDHGLHGVIPKSSPRNPAAVISAPASPRLRPTWILNERIKLIIVWQQEVHSSLRSLLV